MPYPRVSLPEFSTARGLRALGVDRRELAELCDAGALLRVRQGHYARPDAREARVRAVRLGGQLTSYSALRDLGVWCPPGDERLHVAVDPHARRLRDPDTGSPLAPRDDVVVHWKGPPGRQVRDGRGHTAVVPAGVAVLHLPTDLDRAHLVAVLDSIHRGRLAVLAELRREFADVPRLSRALSLVDTRAESGTESIARVRLRDAGIEPELQVRLPPYRVDLLISRRVVVEVDGREFHDTVSTFEYDRRRAAELTRRGFHVLHFSYAQVLYSWPECLAAVRAALAR